VGNPNAFGRPLSELNLPVKALDVSIPPDRPVQTAEEKQAGQQLLAKALDQIGGAARLLAIQDFTQSEESQTRTNRKKLRSTVQFIAPDTIRDEQELEDGSRFIVFYDGKTGWTNSSRGTEDLAEDLFPPIAQNMSHRLLLILRKLSKNPDQATYAGHGVFEYLDAADRPINLTVEENTGVILKVRFHQESHVIEEKFSDWRDVSGMKLPFHSELSQNDKPAGLRTILELRLNSHLNVDELKKRP